ncbi:hypothetical protein BCR36DRAFT_369818 [Piromyces finnis]|uniref:Uncharacterized protein n=1 Tax=Piromyces finnis TaxID=1754191 RepID=A0A1Y1VAL1_9FUNG|nr:hypothetical protein BCR36DRAFT_369818 [Piromyces finnis]|eukprot:ORX51394.1 hypothetical protein BCR36DRAFT_369818 [Piromyces finnis]
MILIISIYMLLLLINATSIYSYYIENNKVNLLKDVNNIVNDIKNINYYSEECNNAYLTIHQCPLSSKSLINYIDLCDNLSKCMKIFKNVDSLKATLADCNNSDTENKIIFENYHNIADNIIQHLETFCYFDEQNRLCPLSKEIRTNNEFTNIMYANNNDDVEKYINNIKLYPKHRIKNLERLKKNCYSEKCRQASLKFIINSWNEIYYLTFEEYCLKRDQINILLSDECYLLQQKDTKNESLDDQPGIQIPELDKPQEQTNNTNKKQIYDQELLFKLIEKELFELEQYM